jgi:hypothetical protein
MISVFGFNSTTSSLGDDENEPGVYVRLIPHEHTLFCERKSKVCEAVGKLQELESLEVEVYKLPPLEAIGSSVVRGEWVRSRTPKSKPNPKRDSLKRDYWDDFVAIDGTINHARYVLTREDVDRYVAFRYYVDTKLPGTQDQAQRHSACKPMGPVLAGPPRLLENTVKITSEKGNMLPSLRVGDLAFAVAHYVGGEQGASEVWWMRVKDGVRENITEPTTLSSEHCRVKISHTIDGGGRFNTPFQYTVAADGSISDPRVYRIKSDDVGWTLKVKYRPLRCDAYKGDVVTSKPTNKVMG